MSACSSSKLVVRSEPAGANVFYSNVETKERRLLGQTPLEIDYGDLHHSNGPYFGLTAAKEGFDEKQVIVPDVLPFRGLSTVSIDFTLKPVQRLQNIDAAVWNQAIELLFDAQKLAIAKQYDQAVTKVETAIKKTGGFHKAYTLLGSVYYLKKDFRRSLTSWETASKLNTHDAEAKKMIEVLKQRLRGSSRE